MHQNLLNINCNAKFGKNSENGPARTQRPAEPLRTYVAIIELTPVRDAIRPEDWPRHRLKIASFAQHAARTLIAENDTFAMHRNELCILTLGDTTRDIASATAAAIGHKIVHDLLGVQGVGRVTLRPRLFEMGRLLASDLALTADTEPADPQILFPDGSGVTPTGTSKPDRLSRRRRLRTLFGADNPAEIDVTYLPIWNLESRMARTFSLAATVRRGTEAPQPGYELLQSPEAIQSIAQFDLANIETGLLDMKASVDAGHESRLLLPLHFETVGSYQGRSELLEIFPNLPISMRQRLSFAVHGIPAGVPQGRLHQVHLMLRPLARDVAAVLTPQGTNSETMWSFAARVRSVGMTRIIIDLPDSPTGNIIDRAGSICSRAASMGLKVGALNLRNGPLAHRLTIAGCTQFGGVLFGGPYQELPEPFPVHSAVFERNC